MLKASLNAPAEEAHDASATSTPGGLVATITGRQSDGALAEVMQVLGGNQDQAMLDFAQLVVRDRFIAVAVLAPDSNAGVSTSSDTVKDIIFRSHAAGFQIDFDACRGSSLSLSSSSSGALSSLSLSDKGSFGDEFIVTMCSLVRIPAKFVADATRILAEQGANIVSINRLTEEDDIYMCIEMVIKLPEGSSTFPSLRRSLFQLGRTQNSPDIAVQKARVTRTAKRIVVFDLSWTLVQCDAIDILLESAGVEPSEPDSEAYRQGKFSGPDWIRNRVLALHGADADKTNTSAIRSLCYTDGAKQLCQGLKRLGCRLAVVSSGSKLIAEQAKEHLGLHFAYGNIFEVDSRHKFTGLVRVCIKSFCALQLQFPAHWCHGFMSN